MNFNPLCAMAARTTIAEVEELVEPGELDPEHIHTPGIFVQRVVVATSNEKRIEKRTVALAPSSGPGQSGPGQSGTAQSGTDQAGAAR
ncbi:putative succinyl-CoA:3-ketoacid coenzyme A transferase subunit A [compost metagenome]